MLSRSFSFVCRGNELVTFPPLATATAKAPSVNAFIDASGTAAGTFEGFGGLSRGHIL